MTREHYSIARVAVHLGAGAMGLALAWWCGRGRKLSAFPTLTMLLAAFVFAESALFPFWFLFVSTQVPIRDEGLAVGAWHLFVIGPAALLAALLSAFQSEIRRIGIGLSLGFVVLGPIAFIFDGFD